MRTWLVLLATPPARRWGTWATATATITNETRGAYSGHAGYASTAAKRGVAQCASRSERRRGLWRPGVNVRWNPGGGRRATAGDDYDASRPADVLTIPGWARLTRPSRSRRRTMRLFRGDRNRGFTTLSDRPGGESLGSTATAQRSRSPYNDDTDGTEPRQHTRTTARGTENGGDAKRRRHNPKCKRRTPVGRRSRHRRRPRLVTLVGPAWLVLAPPSRCRWWTAGASTRRSEVPGEACSACSTSGGEPGGAGRRDRPDSRPAVAADRAYTKSAPPPTTRPRELVPVRTPTGHNRGDGVKETRGTPAGRRNPRPPTT